MTYVPDHDPLPDDPNEGAVERVPDKSDVFGTLKDVTEDVVEIDDDEDGDEDSSEDEDLNEEGKE